MRNFAVCISVGPLIVLGFVIGYIAEAICVGIHAGRNAVLRIAARPHTGSGR